MFQVVSMNECEFLDANAVRLKISVNLAGEYMDVVFALTFEWYDKRKLSTYQSKL